jgi:hypothetical protein
MSELTEQRKKEIWDEIMANPGYSRNVNRNKLKKDNTKNVKNQLSEKQTMNLPTKNNNER